MPLNGKDKLIILDCDGVINVINQKSTTDPDQWKPIPGSMDAIAFLTQGGYTVVVAENMSGIGLNQVTMQQLNEVHSKMHRDVQKAGGRLSGIWFCPHSINAKCECRKPKPGLLKDILDRLHMKSENTWLVGDGIRDMQAIEAIGGHPVLVLTGKGKETLKMQELPDETQIYEDLLDFAKFRRIEDEKVAKVN